MKSALAARRMIDHGLLFEDYLLNFKPFVYAPKIACLSCGSFEHKSCNNLRCSICAENHEAADCPADR
jgi:hypothetical protein